MSYKRFNIFYKVLKLCYLFLPNNFKQNDILNNQLLETLKMKTRMLRTGNQDWMRCVRKIPMKNKKSELKVS